MTKKEVEDLRSVYKKSSITWQLLKTCIEARENNISLELLMNYLITAYTNAELYDEGKHLEDQKDDKQDD